MLPELLEPAAGANATQGQNVLRPGFSPEHAGLFTPGADHRLAARFDDSRADKEALATEGSVFHSFHVADKVSQFILHGLSLRLASTLLSSFLDEIFQAISKQASDPAAALRLVLGMFFAP